MTRGRRDRELIRLVTQELDAEAARRLLREIAEDPRLAERYVAIRRTWEGVELPPEASAPPSLVPELRARIRRKGWPGWSAAPLWARLAAGLALPLGIALGLMLQPSAALEASAVADGAASWTAEADGDTLAGAYYELLVAADEEEAGSS